MDDREFWLEMRRALLLMSNATSDPAVKRGCLQMAASIEKRLGLPKIRVVRERKRAG